MLYQEELSPNIDENNIESIFNEIQRTWHYKEKTKNNFQRTKINNIQQLKKKYDKNNYLN